jgi:hypothetical protein
VALLYEGNSALGRKISVKERAARDGALDLLNTSKNERVRAQMVRILDESDARDKAITDAREKRRLDKEKAKLKSEITSLKTELQAKQKEITALEAEQSEAIKNLNEVIVEKGKLITKLDQNLSDSRAALSSCNQKAHQQRSQIASYLDSDEYDPKVLSQYLKDQNAALSRGAALRVIVLDKTLDNDERRDLAVEIVRDHRDARQQPPLKEFVDEVKGALGISKDEDLEPDYARWYRLPESNHPSQLLKLAAGLEDASPERQKRASRMLQLFYGWTDLNVPVSPRPYGELAAFFEKVQSLKKRSLEDVEKFVGGTRKQNEIQKHWSREDWRNVVKGDNNEAQNLVRAAKSGDTKALLKLQEYQQCSNCGHVSRIDRTTQGHCHHCDRMRGDLPGMHWVPVVQLPEVPYCTGGSIACFT